jgi:hypothetical protein
MTEVLMCPAYSRETPTMLLKDFKKLTNSHAPISVTPVICQHQFAASQTILTSRGVCA